MWSPSSARALSGKTRYHIEPFCFREPEENSDSVEVSTSLFIASVERFMSEEHDQGVRKGVEQESEQY